MIEPNFVVDETETKSPRRNLAPLHRRVPDGGLPVNIARALPRRRLDRNVPVTSAIRFPSQKKRRGSLPAGLCALLMFTANSEPDAAPPSCSSPAPCGAIAMTRKRDPSVSLLANLRCHGQRSSEPYPMRQEIDYICLLHSLDVSSAFRSVDPRRGVASCSVYRLPCTLCRLAAYSVACVLPTGPARRLRRSFKSQRRRRREYADGTSIRCGARSVLLVIRIRYGVPANGSGPSLSPTAAAGHNIPWTWAPTGNERSGLSHSGSTRRTRSPRATLKH